MKLYPLKFDPIFKYRIWGGDKLRTALNKQYSGKCIGESWEISGLSGDESCVNEGPLKGKSLAVLINEFKADLLGNHAYNTFGNEFPLLIKFIDTAKPLSIQVHPNDEVAKAKHASFGKNEMWYVMDADETSELIVGFKRNSSKLEFSSALKRRNIMDLLNVESINKGDVFNIPTGRIHAIGKSVTLLEIQQTSDITYRVYDYNRVDGKTGKKRELHLENALEVIDFTSEDDYKTDYQKDANKPNKLIHSPYFKTNFIHIKSEMSFRLSKEASFRIFICVEGTALLSFDSTHYPIAMGETMLVPACLPEFELKSSDAKLIEVYL